MMQRIRVLTRYFFRTLFTSLPGIIYIILTLTYWLLFFNPQQGTPDFDYFLLVAGVFGPVATFLITMSIAARAYEAANAPFMVRLPSRIEYLTAVLITSLLSATGLQLLMATLALSIRGPAFTLGQLLEAPPVWLSLNVLAAVLALHATDFVAQGWSRVYLFGILAIFLFGQSIKTDTLVQFANVLNRYASEQGWLTLSARLAQFSNTVAGSDTNVVGRFFSFMFWPFRAITDAIVNGAFTPLQAMAPAIILLYATILFLLAADLFAGKDLTFTE